MYKISFMYDLDKIDEGIENLSIEEIYNVYYTPPFEVITTDYGYDYKETEENEEVEVGVIVEEDRSEEVKRVTDILKRVLRITDEEITTEKVVEDFDYKFQEVDLENGWVLCEPSYETDLERINFIPQGAFGTGEHETTKDCLRWILDKDFSGKSVLDIGTGSGILSIAASLKEAKKVTAVDVRDVKDEVDFNASLNKIDNIDVVIGNILVDRELVKDEFDLVIINIGGEETKMFMDFISEAVKKGGSLLVSGLFIKSFEEVVDNVKSHGFESVEEIKGEEWCTAIFVK